MMTSLVLLVPIVVSVTAAPLEQILDDRLISQSKDTFTGSPTELSSIKMDSKKPSRKTKINDDARGTKTSQFLSPNGTSEDRLSTSPRTFPNSPESGQSIFRKVARKPITNVVSKSQTGISKSQTDISKSQTDISKSQTDISQSENDIRAPDISIKSSQNTVHNSQNGVSKSQSDTNKSQGSVKKSQSDVNKSQMETTKSRKDVKNSQNNVKNSQNNVKSSLNNVKSSPNNVKTSPNNVKTSPNNVKSSPNNVKNSQNNVKSPQNNLKSPQNNVIKSQNDVNNMETNLSVKKIFYPSQATSTEKSVLKVKSPISDKEPPELEMKGKVGKRNRKHKSFFYNYPYVPQMHHHYPHYDSNFEDCNFGAEERTPGGKKKYQDSNIYYIRLPPTPYMFVPGLGYVSQPPRYSPPPPLPPLSPPIAHMRPYRPTRPPTIYQPHVNPFIKVPIDFISNGKPTSVYQWQEGKLAPRPDNQITNLDKAPYVFNGRPSSIYLLRPDGSQTVPEPIRYNDYQRNGYY